MWFYLNDSYRELLRKNGLQQFADFMTFADGKVLKRLPSRTILKIELPSAEGKKTFFLKCHKGRLRISEVIRAFFSGFHRSWGRKEWEVIQAFQTLGIPTLNPVAAGEIVSWFRQESFLMTEELTGFHSLERFLKDHFIPPLSLELVYTKRTMIQELARLARIMHADGFNHRDFYCCHIFICHRKDGKIDWRILDLQRVDKRRWARRRWVIKDLAALNYSAPAPLITRADRLRFLKSYLGHQNSLKSHSALIHQVIRKTLRIKKHDLRLQQRKGETLCQEGRSVV